MAFQADAIVFLHIIAFEYSRKSRTLQNDFEHNFNPGI